MITTLLSWIQGQAADHAGQAGEAAGHAAGGPPDLGEMIMHHLVDAHEIELPWGVIHLPTGWYVDLGPLGTVDLAPTKHVVLMIVAAVILVAVFLPLAAAARRRGGESAPTGAGNAMEAMVLYFRDEVVRRNIGHGADAFAPYILTLFFFILVMNLLGLVPWGGSATGNLSVTAALAVMSFVVIEVAGMRELGAAGYAKTIFYAPEGMNAVGKALMLVIMTPVEFLGKLTKPFALAVRLFANMTAGHTLILALGGLIFIFLNVLVAAAGVAVASTLMGTAIMVLELFVAFLQAYIFAMLTAVFIGLIRHAH
ncbi:MAG: F0F1 ATP synthase subunit A [Gemmatimonadetes bacterium]|nr:F0F1 ATP synthase subunit A [Gemmatimonadota bacterium]